AGAASLYEPALLRVVEISPEVLDGAAFFADKNHSVFSYPGLEMRIADGKNYTEAMTETYDVITADPIHPWVSGSGALYSYEHYASCRRHLAAGGVFCQWLPLYQLSNEDIRIILQSFVAAFEHCQLWVTEFDGILIGSENGVTMDHRRFAAVLVDHRIHADLEELQLAAPEAVATCYLLGPRELARVCGGAPMNTEDRPIIEFSSPRSMYKLTEVANLRMLFEAGTPPTTRFADQKDMRLTGDWSMNDLAANARAADLVTSGNLRFGEGDMEGAQRDYRHALAALPGYPAARHRLSRMFLRLGELAVKRDDTAAAAACYEQARSVFPEDVTPDMLDYLGFLYYRLGQTEAAGTTWRTALAMAPGSWSSTNNLCNLLAEQGRFPEALAIIDSFLALMPDHGEAAALRTRLHRAGAAQQAQDS
ncbi:hypothetical protein JW905_17350, partial [bacterium]|nr:hypothetical protein [candidate division CSSED10-310 bacterium]